MDYGIGIYNRNLKTGIRYGVIPVGEINQYWYEIAEEIYSKPSCPYCGNELGKMPSEYVKGKCPHCKHEFETFDNDECTQLIGWKYSTNGYEAHQSEDDSDIWVTKSPYHTYCGDCSPCAPGAGYLTSEGNTKTYCFGHDWLEDGKAPYTVYSVKTGEGVEP